MYERRKLVAKRKKTTSSRPARSGTKSVSANTSLGLTGSAKAAFEKAVARRKSKKSQTPGDGTRARKLSKKDVQAFRELLLAKRKMLAGDVSNMRSEALDRSIKDAAGNLSSVPIHFADIGTDNFEQEFTLELIESEQELLIEIDAALQRIEEGKFGICLATGKPISKARLRAMPWAKHSIEYARQQEKTNNHNHIRNHREEH